MISQFSYVFNYWSIKIQAVDKSTREGSTCYSKKLSLSCWLDLLEKDKLASVAKVHSWMKWYFTFCAHFLPSGLFGCEVKEHKSNSAAMSLWSAEMETFSSHSVARKRKKSPKKQGWYQITKCQGSGLIEDPSCHAKLLPVKLKRVVMRFFFKNWAEKSKCQGFPRGTLLMLYRGSACLQVLSALPHSLFDAETLKNNNNKKKTG